jgi:hypothetical protein
MVMARDFWRQRFDLQRVTSSRSCASMRLNALDSTSVVETFWTRPSLMWPGRRLFGIDRVMLYARIRETQRPVVEPMAKSWKGRQFGGWTVESHIGSGGNGDVYRAVRDLEPGAIKFPRKESWVGQRYERFRSEVEAMKRCIDIPGVLPLFDTNCPDVPSDENPPWFVMLGKRFGT